jgi:hypothetical protein
MWESNLPNYAIGPTSPIYKDKPVPVLRCQFDVNKTSSCEPNTAKITVYNLNEEHRKLLQETFSGKPIQHHQVIVEAGYVGNRTQIFKGDIEHSWSSKHETDWVTTIEAGDGARSYKTARITKSYGKGITLIQVLTDVVKLFEVEPGNLLTKVGDNRRGLIVFKRGVSINGQCAEILNKYLCGAGFQWSIQDGQLLVLEPGETAKEEIVVLNVGSGLIDSPELGVSDKEDTYMVTALHAQTPQEKAQQERLKRKIDDQNKKNGVEKSKTTILKVKSLLQGSIRPGKRIAVESAMISGFFKCEKVTHNGDTWGNEWYTTVEARACT